MMLVVMMTMLDVDDDDDIICFGSMLACLTDELIG